MKRLVGNTAVCGKEKNEFNAGMSCGAHDAHRTSGDFERSQRHFLFGHLKTGRAAFDDPGFAHIELSTSAAVQASGAISKSGSHQLKSSTGESIWGHDNKYVFANLGSMSDGGYFLGGACGKNSACEIVAGGLTNSDFGMCKRLQLRGGDGMEVDEEIVDAETAPTDVRMNEPARTGPYGIRRINRLESSDRLMQNLCMRLGNPSQRCFGNAPFQAWTWMDSFTSLQGTDMLGLTLPAVEEALRSFDQVALPHLEGLRDVWSHFDEGTPDDAAAFLSELWRSSMTDELACCFYQRMGNTEVHEVQNFPIDIPFGADAGQGATFETLVSQWSNLDEGRMVQGGHSAIIFHVGREVQNGAEWAKHHLELHDCSLSKFQSVKMDSLRDWLNMRLLLWSCMLAEITKQGIITLF